LTYGCKRDARTIREFGEEGEIHMKTFDIADASFYVEHDPKGRFWNSKWNLHEEVLAQYHLPNTVSITDSTIREGEETPHVTYRLEDKIKIARLLDEMNVHEVDCGFASINQSHLDFLKALGKENLGIKKSAIARIDLPDFKRGIDRIIEANADIVLCAFYPTPIPGYDWPDYCERVKEAVGHCKENGVFTSFWITCTRWEEKCALDMYRAAIDGGADRIKTAGGGVLTVPAYKRMVKLLKEMAGEAEVGIHAHNNYGTGTACALAGVEAGASNVETSVNGLADGAGLAAFEEVVMALMVMYGLDLGIKVEYITELSRLVQTITGVKVHVHKPLVGEHIFVETSDTHIEGILRARLQGKKTKHFIEPEFIGQKTSLLFGPSALGGESIRLKGDEMGITMSEQQINDTIEIMKSELETVDSISEEGVERIILQACR
jgi:isopropylmalate/homocitrate/citramalate synthase